MPINEITGNTFVAYVDISGFKNYMSNKQKAITALNTFYNSGYLILNNYDNEYNSNYNCNKNNIEGIFVSDCGILFTQNCYPLNDQLNNLLKVLKELNIEMIKNKFMLTTSIAYGEFEYHKKIEFNGISKQAIYGNAYVNAFLNNENEKPKIKPGECRIVKNNLPNEIENNLKNNKFIKKVGKHYYYYWMLKDSSKINDFNNQYKKLNNLKKDTKYEKMIGILSNYIQ